MLDDDLYKFTQSAVVLHNFPDLEVSYEFINRGKTPFPVGFAERLKRQIFLLHMLRLSREEAKWLKSLNLMRPTYVEWLSGYQYNPFEVDVEQNGGELKITIHGPWYRTILWEVKLMSIISELYFMMMDAPIAECWRNRIVEKAEDLSEAECLWCDMGTRRRRSLTVHDAVVNVMKNYSGFIGTSNPWLAMKHKINPIGTSAHESVMAMECLFGANEANLRWLDLWRQYYGEKLNVALTDTFTTDVFLKQMMDIDLSRWQGYRQDSGDPYEWGNKMIMRFNRFGSATWTSWLEDKTFIFSDNLNVPKFIGISEKFRPIVKSVIGGIGTHFTNDTFTPAQVDMGWKPLNMVIKLSGVKVGKKWIGAVKLSDDACKYTGKPEDIARVKSTLNLL